jgi:hypothetical protein
MEQLQNYLEVLLEMKIKIVKTLKFYGNEPGALLQISYRQ